MSYFSSKVIKQKRRKTNEEFIDRLEKENNNLLDRLKNLIKQYNLTENPKRKSKKNKENQRPNRVCLFSRLNIYW